MRVEGLDTIAEKPGAARTFSPGKGHHDLPCKGDRDGKDEGNSHENLHDNGSVTPTVTLSTRATVSFYTPTKVE